MKNTENTTQSKSVKKEAEKSLNKMKLLELYEMKSILKDLSDRYGDMITTNYEVNGYISKFTNISNEDKIILDKRLKVVSLISKIDNLIEEKVMKLYDKEN